MGDITAVAAGNTVNNISGVEDKARTNTVRSLNEPENKAPLDQEQAMKELANAVSFSAILQADSFFQDAQKPSELAKEVKKQQQEEMNKRMVG